MSAAEADRVLERVRAQGLLGEGRVLVLLSGGRDSTCLLDAAVRIRAPGWVTALHCNYGLRPGADGDEEHCRALCEALGVSLEVRRPLASRGNVQAWARRERYAAAAELVAANGVIATGHTASDQVETILYRLASSPSRRALLGMAPRDGRLVRPLLALTREQTAEYCRERGLSWRDDPSNDDGAFARARVRHELVPALRRVHPAAEQNVAALAERLREEAAVLDALVAEILQGGERVALERLDAAGPALARLVVQRLADAAAGAPAAGVARRTPDLLALRRDGIARLHVGAGLQAVCERGELRLERLPSAQPSPARPDEQPSFETDT